MTISYWGVRIGALRVDLLIQRRVIVELKAVAALNELHRAQLISYLKATRLSLGLLINFNVPLLRDGVRRVVMGREQNAFGSP